MRENEELLRIQSIIDYWFADIGTGFHIKQQHQLWYGASPAVDQHIKQCFGSEVASALTGALSSWAATAHGSLALVLLLDQFARNIFRGSAQAFAGDHRAREIVEHALKAGFDRQLSFIQRSFLYMPLEHSESLLDQHRSVELFQQLLQQVPPAGHAAITSSVEFAKKHRDIILRFGRFPHRNKALGRLMTADEQAYLRAGGARFGQ